MAQAEWTDPKIINYIRETGPKYKEGFKACYNKYQYLIGDIQKILKQKGRDTSTAEDYYHEALLTFRFKIKRNEISEDTNIAGYLLGIVKKKQFGDYRTKVRRDELLKDVNPDEKKVPTPSDILEENLYRSLFQDAIEQIGDECKELLNLGVQGYPLKDIWNIMSLKSYFSTRKKMQKCKDKLRKYLKKHHLQKIIELEIGQFSHKI